MFQIMIRIFIISKCQRNLNEHESEATLMKNGYISNTKFIDKNFHIYI